MSWFISARVTHQRQGQSVSGDASCVCRPDGFMATVDFECLLFGWRHLASCPRQVDIINDDDELATHTFTFRFPSHNAECCCGHPSSFRVSLSPCSDIDHDASAPNCIHLLDKVLLHQPHSHLNVLHHLCIQQNTIACFI